MNRYKVEVSLKVLGPFITASTGAEDYALQKAFHRDQQDKPVIPASHVKGKLRMAVGELSECQTGDEKTKWDSLLGLWFGRKSEDVSGANGYEPSPGVLLFSDFQCEAHESGSQSAGQNKRSDRDRRSRVAIQPRSRNAAEHQLRDLEDRFKSGSIINCSGDISFFAANLDDAVEWSNSLRIAFQWLPTLGGEKSVGFGRVLEATVSRPTPIEDDETRISSRSVPSGDRLILRIQPHKELLIGGIKKRRTNYVDSETIIPGGSIKGALAMALNKAFSIDPFHRELNAGHAADYPGFENLVEHFSTIRVTHALPAYTGQPRPMVFPISTAKFGGFGYWDTALTSSNSPIYKDYAPEYFVDWKGKPQEITEAFGLAEPKKYFITRTAINPETRRALESQLYTYAYCCPEDDDGNAIEWICVVSFEDIEPISERRLVINEFQKAVGLYLKQLGKRGSAVAVKPDSAEIPPAMQSMDDVEDDLVVITLQSDTIMLNPEEVGKLSLGEDLHDLYDEYWCDMSGGEENPAEAALALIDFYAHQVFKGGYMYHRYLGALERHSNPDSYYPFYLTGAGSVFKLRIKDEQEAGNMIDNWLKSGLNLPTWAMKRYSQDGAELWKCCPFIRQNGYGEIAVNLKWHWDKRI